MLSIESIGFNKIQSIDKKLLVKGNLKIDSLLFDKFDFKSPASIKDLKTGTTIDVQGKKNFKYITNSIHLESDYCEKSACILNEYKQNSHPKRQGRISVNRLDGHEVTIKSKAYQDIVETNEIIKGDFTFFSINDNGNVLSEIKVGPKGSIKVKNQKGKLTNTKVGRFDVFYKDSDGKTMQKHWSSKNLLQKKNRKFFRSKNKFVTCQVGVNCELQFAKNFGKVKFARGKKGQYKHAIFVGGDHPSTAISALKSKKCIKEGCIVLNSRDIPKNSNAQEWTITGHHLEQSEFLWRDCPTASGGEHCAIDQVRLVNDLPKAKNLKKISFSACNTINGNENDMSVNLYLAKMAQKYYGTNFVGVSGTELYHREFDDLTGKIKYKNWKSGKDKREGKRVSFLYDSQKDRYVYNDGDIKFSVDIDILVEESENQLSFNVPVGGEVSEQEI